MTLTARDIEAEAARFAIRVENEGRTPALEAEIEQWIGDDSRRRGAFLRAEAAWALVGQAGEAEEAAPQEASSGRVSRRGLLAGGGGLLAASVALGLFALSPGERYETRIGEISRVPLADGSVASINSDTELAVRLEKSARVVELARGEAWLQVAKDARRPFTVEAGRVRVRAVGTAFSVRRRNDGADVLVTDGVVESWVEGAEGHRVRIAAGERAFVADNAAISKESHAAPEIDRALAWRSGRIDLAGESLAAAVAEINRYNARKIVVADPELAREPLHGMFRTDDPEGFAATVEAITGAEITQRGPERIVIASKRNF
ncbi:FecR family protein [Sphingosinicella rhizophila]|uniref:FecR domain-containing protein n=1 Tax=Sphingosinicella rhizophila TaxID=3050082 RepID=A0ABU3Q308_9SPHN|nr:FecR domain-containing protein [Sphingosinicella sp. GR2756]MDT9597373.1 FecR domain-containing protein [Sphingosinicella sp. GR2756]